MEKLLENKLRPTMLDPSLLARHRFWESIQNLQSIFPTIYVPKGVQEIKDSEFREFYGGYIYEPEILRVKEIIKRSQETFRWFSWKEYGEKIPEQLAEGFDRLKFYLEDSYLSMPVRNILLDEFVFLSTQSSILSRMKKTFKMLEKFNALPLLNLEEIVPEEWQKSVSGLKIAINSVNWIAFIGTFSLWLGPIGGFLGGSAVTGIRLFLIDPTKSDNSILRART
jgi:hypothetical protein